MQGRDSYGSPYWVFLVMHIGCQGSVYMHEICAEILAFYVGFLYWPLAIVYAACAQGSFYDMRDSLLGLLLHGGAGESAQGLRYLADGLRDSLGFPCWVFHTVHFGCQGSVFMHEHVC